MLLFLILPLLCAGDVAARAALPRRGFRAAGQVPLWSSPHDAQHQKSAAGPGDDLDDWMTREEGVALERLLDNAAPCGKHVDNLPPGTIVASPSKKSPDYFYQCTRAPFEHSGTDPSPGTRDSAIAIDTLLDAYADEPASKASARISPVLHGYALLSRRLQRTLNPSGTFSPDLSGLGEPKFRADGRPFDGPWGRPQRDGPALRALALMKYLRLFNGTTADGDDGKRRGGAAEVGGGAGCARGPALRGPLLAVRRLRRVGGGRRAALFDGHGAAPRAARGRVLCV